VKQVKPPRADGRANRERIVAIAATLIARDGAQASLEEIARAANVGSATVHRHFPSRRALLEAVFRDGVAQLCARAVAQPGRNPGAELCTWLEELTVYTAANRGLATALLAGPDGLSPEEVCCTAMVLDVLRVLVERAAAASELRAGVTSEDLVMLTNAIAASNEADPPAARRLLRLALSGIQPATGTDS